MISQAPHNISVFKRLRYLAEAGLAYILYAILYCLPVAISSALCGKTLRLVGPHMGISKVARRNIALAFPEKSQTEQETILTGMWENLGRVIGEYPHLHRIWKNCDLIGAEYIEQLRDDNKPGIFVAGHTGNWEIHAISAKQLGLPLHLVYRRPNNPYVDALLCHARASGAEAHIAKGLDGARHMLRALKNKKHLGVLIDQKLREGIPVPFFGTEVMTAPAIAQFALKFDCPIVPAWCQRTTGAHFKVTIFPPLDVPALTANATTEEEKILHIMTHINQQLESWIRQAPEQWLWLHRRWG